MNAPSPALVLAVVLAACAPSCSDDEPPPEQAEAGRYVEDATCASCHQQAWETWSGSHHDLSTQVAAEDTVLADFDDARFVRGGLTTRFLRRDGRFLVATEGPDGERGEFEVRYVLGAESVQQYLVELPGGRVQCLRIAWDVRRGAWFSLDEGNPFEPGHPRHWSGRYQRWNASCAECHSTGVVRGYEPEDDRYDTTWAELDVGCQACHGPGSDHLTWATSYDQSLDATMGLDVRLAPGARRSELNVCAPCHSRREPLSEGPHAGAQFLDHFAPERLRADLYHPDGQMRDEVYTYGSFVQSRMHARGVGCGDCHDPHGLELRAAGNALCTRCHSEVPPTERYPTLRIKNYDTPRHHFHETATPGAACVDCHMPAHTSLGVDRRRDHSFRVPRPDLTSALGVPNACNDCHTAREEDADWAAARIEEWHGGERTSVPHFALTFAAAREGDSAAGPALMAIAQDRSQAPIVRATALDLARELGLADAEILRGLLEDPDALVRRSAVGCLGVLPVEQREPAFPLLDDPVRAVRVEAARVLGPYPTDQLGERRRSALADATLELHRAQRVALDLPPAHLELGRYHASLGADERAAEALRRALAQDPYLLAGQFELVALLRASGEDEAAVRLLQEGIERQPDEGELYHALGLLYAQLERPDEAAPALVEAARLLPDRARVQLDAGLALERAGRLTEAERLMMDATLLAPRDPLARQALVVLHLRLGQDARALEHARVLTGLIPDSPQAQVLLERIRVTLEE